MPIELINKIKIFNQPVVEAELAAITPALPAYTVQWAGFVGVRGGFGRIEPFAEATRVIARKNGVEDVAARGDIRFDTRNSLTAAQVTSINTVLDDHDPDASGDTPEQSKERQTTADIAELRAIYDAGIADRTMELNTKLTLIESGEDL
jgi:hypothetical protein